MAIRMYADGSTLLSDIKEPPLWGSCHYFYIDVLLYRHLITVIKFIFKSEAGFQSSVLREVLSLRCCYYNPNTRSSLFHIVCKILLFFADRHISPFPLPHRLFSTSTTGNWGPKMPSVQSECKGPRLATLTNFLQSASGRFSVLCVW